MAVPNTHVIGSRIKLREFDRIHSLFLKGKTLPYIRDRFGLADRSVKSVINLLFGDMPTHLNIRRRQAFIFVDGITIRCTPSQPAQVRDDTDALYNADSLEEAIEYINETYGDGSAYTKTQFLELLRQTYQERRPFLKEALAIANDKERDARLKITACMSSPDIPTWETVRGESNQLHPQRRKRKKVPRHVG